MKSLYGKIILGITLCIGAYLPLSVSAAYVDVALSGGPHTGTNKVYVTPVDSSFLSGYSPSYSGVYIAGLDSVPLEQSTTSGSCYELDFQTICGNYGVSTTTAQFTYNSLGQYFLGETIYFAWVAEVNMGGGNYDYPVLGWTVLQVALDGTIEALAEPTLISRIEYVIPNYGAEATGTPMLFRVGYQNWDGYDRLGWSVMYQSSNSGFGTTTATSELQVFDISSGSTTQDFTFDLEEGSYWGTVTMVDDDGVMPEISQHVTFYVGRAYDAFWGFNTPPVSGVSTSSVSWSSDNCTFGNFDLGKCSLYLFVPTPSDLERLAFNFLEAVGQAFPFNMAFKIIEWFYVTEADIIAAATPEAADGLPDLAFTIPAGMPGAGTSVDFSPWGNLMGEGSMIATAEVNGENFLDGWLSWWEWGWKVVFGFWLLFQLLGTGNPLASAITRDEAKRKPAPVVIRKG